jgi:signal transduction histidine kinase
MTRAGEAGGLRSVSPGRRAFYLPLVSTSESGRVQEAHARAERRLRRQRDILRPLGIAVAAAVVASAANGHPAPGLQGRPLGVTLALVAFALLLLLSIRAAFLRLGIVPQALAIAVMGAAAVALVALQPHSATELAAGAAVWMAVARLPVPLGPALALATTVALALAVGFAGGSAAAVVASTLLCALLGLVAYFVQETRASQAVTEQLLARLEDARDEQLQAAAARERGRIASELHDVLAHSLSGAAIQLQGARMLAEREQASPKLGAAIDRAGELVRDGLANARQAVGALRGEQLPGITQLDALVAGFRDDMHVDVTLSVAGSARVLPADASLALYRGAQEALTNVARYAAGATTTVVLHYDESHTTLTVEDRDAGRNPDAGGLTGVGGGSGLAGMRERLERAGGTMRAGPTATGWRVELDVPA